MRVLLLLLIPVVLLSCGSKQEKADDIPPPPPKPKDTLPYYDLAAAIKTEMKMVTARKGVFIYTITEENGKRDSVVIDTARFKLLAQPFVELQLNDTAIKNNYTESVFADNDTKSYVLNYKTESNALPVKSVSIMLETQFQQFKRADLLKSYTRNDTLFQERLAWNTGKKFQLVQIISVGNTEFTKQTYVYWRDRK